jgi:hypothetical protein
MVNARFSAALVTALVCFAPLTTSAQQASAAKRADRDALQTQLGAELTFGQIDEDLLLTVAPRFALQVGGLWQPGCDEDDCRATLRLGVHVPLRLRVLDRPPVEGDTLRLEDWDEPGDYLRVLRYFIYGDEDQRLHIRLGELGPLTLGDGTLVYSHFNTITPDNHRPGARLAIGDSRLARLDAFLDHLLAPQLLGADLSLRPLNLFADTPDSPLSLGLTYVTDLNAPLTLSRDADGTATLDSRRYPQVQDASPSTWLAARLGLDLFDTETGRLTLTLSGASHLTLGQGAHLNTRYSARVADITLDAQLEGFVGTAGYMPRAIGPLYEFERYQARGYGIALPAPRQRIAATLKLRDELTTGLFASAAADLQPLLTRVEIAHQRRFDLDDADLFTARLISAPIDRLQLGAHLIWLADSPLILATEARYDLLPHLYLIARFNRTSRTDDLGDYRAVPDWHLGLGAQL